MKNEDRPPMHCLIWTIIVATGLISLAVIASAVFFVLLAREPPQPLSFIPFVVAVTLFYSGIRSMRTAIGFLRGKAPPAGDWEKWIFWIWVWRM